MGYRIIIHGGLNYSSERNEEETDICKQIVNTVEHDLKQGANALDACEKAINLLEDHPFFDAGTGSYIQIDGKIRMDACIMTSNYDMGAVLQISDVKNPISVARKILENPYHTVLSGDGAMAFAKESGFPAYNPMTEETLNIYRGVVETLKNDISYRNLCDHKETIQRLTGTVGCVVQDQNGLIAAGTSTGGRKVCYPGRVGDSGLPGNGTYADPFAGISCTGEGEKIMRIGMARAIAFSVESGYSLSESCRNVLNKLKSVDGRAGVIAVSRQGEIAYAFNTPAMPFALAEG